MLIEERQKVITLVGEFVGIRNIHKIPEMKIQLAI